MIICVFSDVPSQVAQKVHPCLVDGLLLLLLLLSVREVDMLNLIRMITMIKHTKQEVQLPQIDRASALVCLRNFWPG